jgi:hypothetical protein
MKHNQTLKIIDSVVLSHVPITPKFPSGSRCEFFGDYVET